MKTVRLKGTALVGETHYGDGDVVAVPDDRAHRMIAAGQAEAHDGTFEAADNAHEANPLGDTLIPIPRGAVPVHPPDALAPNVAEHPGLKKLVEVLDVEGEVDAKGRTATIRPVPTSEVAPDSAVEASHRLAQPPTAPAPTHEEAAAMVAARDEAAASDREAEGRAETASIDPAGRTAVRGTGRPKARPTPPAATEVKVGPDGPADVKAGPPAADPTTAAAVKLEEVLKPAEVKPADAPKPQ